MKNNNRIVSLFILTGALYAGSANAAQIASSDYVDRQDALTLETVASTYATKETVDLKADASELAKKEDVSNKTQTIDSSSTPEQYPSAAAVYGALGTKADANAVDGKLNANPDIEPGTGTKITYDAKGLVTGSTDLEVADLPDAIPTSKIDGLATVATTGSYNDLSDKPASAVVDSELTPDGTNAVQGKVIYQALQGKQNAGDYATTEALNTGLSAKQDVNKIVQAIRSTSEATTENYPSEKAVADALANKADSSALSNYATTESVNTSLETKEDKLNKVQTIDGSSTETQYPSAKAVHAALTTKANVDNVYDKSTIDQKLQDLTLGGMEGVEQALAGKEDNKNKASAITDLNKVSTDEYTSVKAVVDYVIPKPGAECQAESNLCVLSVDRDGNISWVNVTNPAN